MALMSGVHRRVDHHSTVICGSSDVWVTLYAFQSIKQLRATTVSKVVNHASHMHYKSIALIGIVSIQPTSLSPKEIVGYISSGSQINF